MDNKEIIERFYRAFAAGDPETMAGLYHENIVFTDPAFDELKGKDAGNMWRMLVNPGLKLTFSNVKADDRTGSADWVAEYVFSQTGRKVINRIHAEFEFRDGKIVRHTDDFSFWKWSRQALGLPGWLLGWTPVIRNKVNRQARERLRKFGEKIDQAHVG